jgi:hypothetical protein
VRLAQIPMKAATVMGRGSCAAISSIFKDLMTITGVAHDQPLSRIRRPRRHQDSRWIFESHNYALPKGRRSARRSHERTLRLGAISDG